ncbi:MAG: response regulator [Gallionella sp.]|nr:response regulator [Gallionella sp.]
MSETSRQIVSILAIEDDPGDFGLIQAYARLAKLGDSGSKASVTWAKKLADGITMARNDKPDVVLLDLSLSDSEGLATVQAMRDALHDVPIVVLTGHDDNAIAIAALHAGAQDYLVKGQFDHDALGRAVRHALARHALELRLRESEKILLDSRNHLKEQVTEMTSQLKELRDEFEDVNTTLKVLLKNRDTDKSAAQDALVSEMSQEVAPFLLKLKKSVRDCKQIRLLGVLENNLQQLASSYGNTNTYTLLSWQLTPVEIQVASMIKQGLSTKDIATALSISPETINVHRKHIRKKLGLSSKASNLRSHLTSLSG